MLRFVSIIDNSPSKEALGVSGNPENNILGPYGAHANIIFYAIPCVRGNICN